MDHAEATKKINELMEGITIGMMANRNQTGQIVSRPMALQQAEFDGDLWFFSYDTSEKVAELKMDPEVNVGFNGKNSWVSLSGRAEIGYDEAKAKELWNPILKAWFPDELETKGLTLIKVNAASAEYWDTTSNKLTQLFGMAKAVATGQPAQGGENEVVKL